MNYDAMSKAIHDKADQIRHDAYQSGKIDGRAEGVMVTIVLIFAALVGYGWLR